MNLQSNDPEFDPRSNRTSEKGRRVVLSLRTREEHMHGYMPLWPGQPNKAAMGEKTTKILHKLKNDSLPRDPPLPPSVNNQNI